MGFFELATVRRGRHGNAASLRIPMQFVARVLSVITLISGLFLFFVFIF